MKKKTYNIAVYDSSRLLFTIQGDLDHLARIEPTLESTTLSASNVYYQLYLNDQSCIFEASTGIETTIAPNQLVELLFNYSTIVIPPDDKDDQQYLYYNKYSSIGGNIDDLPNIDIDTYDTRYFNVYHAIMNHLLANPTNTKDKVKLYLKLAYRLNLHPTLIYKQCRELLEMDEKPHYLLSKMMTLYLEQYATLKGIKYLYVRYNGNYVTRYSIKYSHDFTVIDGHAYELHWGKQSSEESIAENEITHYIHLFHIDGELSLIIDFSTIDRNLSAFLRYTIGKRFKDAIGEMDYMGQSNEVIASALEDINQYTDSTIECLYAKYGDISYWVPINDITNMMYRERIYQERISILEDKVLRIENSFNRLVDGFSDNMGRLS